MTAIHSHIKILHVEDVPTDADQVAWILKKTNIAFEIKVVSSRNEYRNALSEFRPEIIISDHRLPAFNSIEALRLLKQADLHIPFILVTGTVSEEFAVEAMREGADDYVLKDRMQRLPSAVFSALKKYQLEGERKKTEMLLRNINANSLDVICSVDESGHFLHVSDACQRIWGYSADELIGKNILDFVYAEDHITTVSSAENIMSGKNVTNFENRYVRKDGSLAHMIWSSRWDEKDRIRYGVARDATEIKKMQQVVKRQQQRFIDLFLEAPACIGISKGPTHVYEIFNPFYLELTGRKNIVGKTVADVFPELVSQGLIQLLDQVYQTGVSVSGKEMSIRIDRERSGQLTEVYFNFVFKPYRDEYGLIEGIFFFAIDVTEEIRARKKIEDSRKKYIDLVQNLPAAAYTCDVEGNILLFNKAAVELWGSTPEPGKDLWDGSQKVYNLDMCQISYENSSMAKSVKEGKSIHGEQIIIERPDGTRRNVVQHLSPQFDSSGRVIGAINMQIDVTESRRIEEENRKLALIASTTVNAVIISDVNGKITWVNKGFERITEYSFSEVIGKKPGHFLQGKETDPNTILYMRECCKNDRGFRVEIINYTKSGRIYWLDIEVMPLVDPRNRITGFMAIEQDISERKKSEEETHRLIDHLQRKNNNLQQFSYIVSHNLRAHIAKILGLTSIMENDPEENQALCKIIADEVNNLDSVVNDINTIVSARKPSKEKLDITYFQEKLEKVKHVFESQILEIGATITSDFSEAESVSTVKSYLYSIVFNLLSNAIKYRDSSRTLQVHFKTAMYDSFICLSVEDNGIGIDLTKNKKHIFGLYKRFHEGSVPGRGLGLNMVKTHAESLGGRVDVESIVNQGTVFKVFIPKVPVNYEDL